MVRQPNRGDRRDGVSNGGNRRYKGVRMRKWGKWVAEVRQPNSRDRIWLGSYETPEEAARAYDAAVFCLRGPPVSLNIPETPPDIPSPRNLTPSQIQVAASRHAHRYRTTVNSGEPPYQPPREQVSTEVVATTAAAERSKLVELYMQHNSAFGGISSTDEYYVSFDQEEDSLRGGTFFYWPRVSAF